MLFYDYDARMDNCQSQCNTVTVIPWCFGYRQYPYFYSSRYVPNVAKRSTWEHCNIEDRRPNDRPRILENGHISTTGHPIHFMFGSRVGFSRSADQMALLPVGPNPRWRLEKFQMAISPQRTIRSTSGLILGLGFRGRRIEWTYSRLRQIFQETAPRHLGKFRMTISLEWVICSTFMN